MLAKSRSMTPSFAADHPFIFLIRDNASGSILFLGKLVDPSEEASKE
jgi:serpin B